MERTERGEAMTKICLVIAAVVIGVPLVNWLLGHAVDALLAWSENRKWW